MAEPVMRPISGEGFKRPEVAPSPGRPPELEWLPISALVVDERYQRPIYGAGCANVARIAANFSWSMFAPLIVSPIGGGRYAVVDGQHRATAALLIGLERLPAMVVLADTRDQAAVFKAVNGGVTKVHALTLHHAAVAAGDAEALEIERVAAAGKASIAPYPRTPDRMPLGETLALGTIRETLKSYGADVVITALMCVTETSNNKPGAVSATLLKALCDMVERRSHWAERPLDLLDAVDVIDLQEELEEAKATRRPKGVAAWETLADRLATSLEPVMGR